MIYEDAPTYGWVCGRLSGCVDTEQVPLMVFSIIHGF